MPPLNELDEKLKKLEEKMNCMESESDTGSSDENRANDREQAYKRDGNEGDLPPAPSLPSELLPAPNVSRTKTQVSQSTKGNTKRQERDEGRSSDHGKEKRMRRVEMPEDIQPSRRQPLFDDERDEDAEGENIHTLKVVEHRTTKAMGGRLPSHAAAAAETAMEEVKELMQEKPWCRMCEMEFETKEELEAHRGTDAHKAKEEEDRRQSYCPLCDKQVCRLTIHPLTHSFRFY